MADKPITREEKHLAYLTGDYTGEIPKPITRKEKYLYELCLKGMGGEVSPEEIKSAVNEYLEKNPVKPGATTEQAQQIEQNKTDIASLKTETSSLKEDLTNKITKFYASNQGETHLADSDNGKIMDMMLYGKSSQDGTPSPENPVEIKSVVNPTVKVVGKNLYNFGRYAGEYVFSGSDIKATVSKDGFFTVRGTAETYASVAIGEFYVDFPNGDYHVSLSGNNNVMIQAIGDEGANFNAGGEKAYKFINGKKADLYIVVLQAGTFDVTFRPMICKGKEELSTFEPYHEQTVTLPYTLNAIPVSSGGNVTIDGQQYIADYVDVERGKLVKKLKSFTIADVKAIYTWGTNKNADNITGFYSYMSANGLPKSNNEVMASTILRYSGNAWGGTKVGCAVGSDTRDNYAILSVPTNILEDISSDENVCASLVKICENTNAIFFYIMTSPIETDLAPEEITAFKALATYYPTTNISVNSEQLDGYTVFNYPISMQNGWNYVKQQLNDNRDYIYNIDAQAQDIDTQSAEAYVNSEYAVALTELEV